jgi:hypothetical protein
MAYLGRVPANVPVTASDIPDNSITAAKILDGVITPADLSANAVTTAKIAGDAIDGTKIADNAIAIEHIGANAVGVSELNLSDGSANQYLQTDGAGTISFASISSGATGGGTDEVFVNNSQTITTDYTVPVGKSASSTGPITMNAGVDITLSAGSRWVIL